jgi:hypothetical protein
LNPNTEVTAMNDTTITPPPAVVEADQTLETCLQQAAVCGRRIVADSLACGEQPRITLEQFGFLDPHFPDEPWLSA